MKELLTETVPGRGRRGAERFPSRFFAMRDEGRAVLVLGVGNILLRDEGLGVRAVEHLRERYVPPEGVELVDGGCGGLRLLSLLASHSRVIVIDAARAGGEPGSVYRIPGERLHRSLPLMTACHDVGLKELLAMAQLEGANPEELVVIAVEPADISPGLELSETVRERLDDVASLVKDELARFGYDLRRLEGSPD
ncbi:MAG TPA: hydrogenase maturation protease [Deltaproteobacteria bacterium]|nr:hydrogenase maturation protease [Deltaproteobacteria bacterium]